MNNKELEAICNLPAQKRYEYFVKKIADYEEVWGLFNEGWAVSEDEKGNKLIPFWPKEEFAKLCAIGDWKSYKPKSLDLDSFMSKWLTGMKEDGLKPSIFWNNKDSIVVETNVLLSGIEEELENY